MSALVERSAAGISYLASGGGEGLPVVLLHGIGSNAQSFAPLLQAFDVRHPALAWNAPGYGVSQPLAMDWPDASDYAAALNRLLVDVGIARCVLVGHSLGCLIAARFALVSPRRVAALVLVSPALGHGAEKGAPLPPAVGRRIEDLDRLGPAQFAAARAPSLVAEPAARPDVVQAVEQAMADVRRPGYDQAARLLAVSRLLDDAAKLDVPTTVIVGIEDRITPPANVRRAFAALPEAPQRHTYFEVANAGHAICQEQPAEIARIITAIVEHKANVHA
jgi:pimeloyl-ACP methyl ester carboxylesterase